PRQRIGQSRGLGLRIVADAVERGADRGLHAGRGSERIDAGREIRDVAPVPPALAADREDVAAVHRDHRITPASRPTISSDDPYNRTRVFRYAARSSARNASPRYGFLL